MTAQELREKYLKFFQSKGHTIIPSASLIPEGTDPTALFITAGMHPLVPYLMGENHPSGKRLTNAQKCVRTDDIDEVGDPTHNTFFEMLGNWSLGDYFKKESIEWSWELLTSEEYLNLDPKRIAVSVFAGDADAERDNEAADIWLAVSEGELDGRIDFLPKKKNWWGPAGTTGPCGPDTEIFYWVGGGPAPEKITPGDLSDHPHWVEIWNNVFMQYNKNSEGKYEPLQQKNVDTGMGMERVLAIANGFGDIYKTELFKKIIAKVEKLSDKKYEDYKKEFRIITDHMRASVFMISDGVVPSNVQGGYVLRRLIRRAIRYGKLIRIENNFTKQIAEVVIEMYGSVYPELEKNKNIVFNELEKEEEKFRRTLEKGLKELEKIVISLEKPDKQQFEGSLKDMVPYTRIVLGEEKFSGKKLFDLYQNYGFPLEMSIEELKKYHPAIQIDEDGFNEELKKHQELSRTASAGMFKGGLADAGEETVKLHTAAHLLLAALREVLGEETYQKGSNITAERLRFDFNYPEKMTDEQIKKVEDLVNQKIQENIPVEMTQMPKNEALKNVKVSFDPSKYGDVVKVYSIGNFSSELCGGPHVKSIGELGKFKIKKEESSGAGVRRIKAVLE